MADSITEIFSNNDPRVVARSLDDFMTKHAGVGTGESDPPVPFINYDSEWNGTQLIYSVHVTLLRQRANAKPKARQG
jgi:hypothetical protein